MSVPASKQIVHRLYQQYVTDRDHALLDLVFDSSVTQQKLDETLQICDIEAMGAHKSLMLSYLMHEHPELIFSAYNKPRLKGLVDFYRFANLRVLAHFSKIGKALNAANIPILIFKGAAMKALRPELSRPMADVDILIPAKFLPEAVTICERLGYHDARTGNPLAVDILTADNKSAVDIHKAILGSGKSSEAFSESIFNRAHKVEAFGVQAFLPTHEDLFFIVLANLTKNLRAKSSIHGLFYALFDVKFLLSSKQNFDWAIVREHIHATGMELPTRFAADFMDHLVPGIIPNMDTNLPLTPAIEAYCNQMLFDEDHFLKKQAECQAIRVVELKNYPLHYGKMILKLLLLKKLRNFPRFVRWYLKKHESSHENR